MLRLFLPLTIAATLLAPLAPMAVYAQAPANTVNGSITAKDATTITVTPRARRGAAAPAPTATAPVVVTVGSAKIFKATDPAAGPATGTADDLTVGANVRITTDGKTPPTATEIHLRAARAPRTPAAPPTPAPAPAAPATP